MTVFGQPCHLAGDPQMASLSQTLLLGLICSKDRFQAIGSETNCLKLGRYADIVAGNPWCVKLSVQAPWVLLGPSCY